MLFLFVIEYRMRFRIYHFQFSTRIWSFQFCVILEISNQGGSIGFNQPLKTDPRKFQTSFEKSIEKEDLVKLPQMMLL